MADLAVRTETRLGSAALEEVKVLLAAVAAVEHREVLSEHKRVDLLAGGADRFVALFVRAGHAGPLTAYAQLSGEPEGWGLEAVVTPSLSDDESLIERLLSVAVTEAARRGGGPVRYWVSEPRQPESSGARAAGFRPERELRQLRVPLPLPPEIRAAAPVITVRGFRVGLDEAAWLDVNNRAFAGHPEQGGWKEADLKTRMAQPWFDADGLLLCELDGRLAGSCWTKVHRDPDGDLGEIYAIGVDPEFHGRGLGRALTVAGLDHLASVVPTGMLYVDAANAPAVALYTSLGFVLHHADHAFRRDVDPVVA
jgi:mycothiol synthase